MDEQETRSSNTFHWLLVFMIALICPSIKTLRADNFVAVALQSEIKHVQPMTGIVLWDDSDALSVAGSSIQLEYSYVKYSDVVTEKGVYDWSKIDKKLDAIATRQHQAVLRFYYTYVGEPTTVPKYIQSLPGYKETSGIVEGKQTSFPDWTSAELQQFTLDFYSAFAKRYDEDPRLAFLQTGFGLWAEYHIYEGPFELGKTFPDKAFQAKFLQHLDGQFKQTPWMISIDAADTDVSPIVKSAALSKLNFGLFDDSFLSKEHAKVNEENWNALDRQRFLRSPAGGEFNYYTKKDQKLALSEKGPNGESFESAAKRFHISFMIGDGQPKFQKMNRIAEAGMACGYRFRVTELQTDRKVTRVVITNSGVAPCYYDAYPAINSVRAAESLKGLSPGETKTFNIDANAFDGTLTIQCDRLVAGQTIEYEAGAAGSKN